MIRISSEEKLLTAGDYLCDVVVAEERQSKSNEANTNLHLEVVVNAETHPDWPSKRLFTDVSLTEAASFRVRELARAAFGDIKGMSDEDGMFEFEPNDVVGVTIGCTVDIDDTYDGRPRERIVGFFPASEFGAVVEEEGTATESDSES